MKRYIVGLGGQIVLSMVVATVSSVVLTIFGLYLFYGTVLRVAPEWLAPLSDGWFPDPIEWLVIFLLCVMATCIALSISLRLSRRIVAPLVSVAQSARQIADGDLTVRAEANDPCLAEATILVDDFNLLAKRLEQASDALTRWNATIAHELRTPVTILSGRLQGLADGVFQPDPPLLRSLVTQVEGLVRLIEDLRTVSLLDGGRLDIRFQPVELSDEIEAVLKLMQPGLENAGFSLTSKLDKGECEVDTGRIRQAVIALLENAKRHALPATIDVQLSITDHSAYISITDQGPGLPPDFARYAFEPFRRYMEQGGAAKGSGLGLAVVMGIAQAHGGKASYQMIRGGARFALEFPRRRLNDEANIIRHPL
ncbi:MAG: HAMP domain-containing histidine kinase [Sphingobium sp.]|nr:HAMP domain-containing histidine kinase [Sphingobium sp.]